MGITLLLQKIINPSANTGKALAVLGAEDSEMEIIIVLSTRGSSKGDEMRLKVFFLAALLVSLITYILFGIAVTNCHAGCGPYGCLEPFTACVDGVCVSTIPTPTPAPTPTPTTIPTIDGIPGAALIAVQKIYCNDKLCIIIVQPVSALNK